MVGLPQCAFCTRYLGDSKCPAFPERIPDAVWDGRHNHREPYPGDHGVRFEPTPDGNPRPAYPEVSGEAG